MGAMGRYIDGLSEEARDRLLEAQTWLTHNPVDGAGGGCLRGHAEGLARLRMQWEEIKRWKDYDEGAARKAVDVAANRWFFSFPREVSRHNPAHAFNGAVERFGLDRVVRAIKLRAAKPHRVSLEAPAAVVSTEAA